MFKNNRWAVWLIGFSVIIGLVVLYLIIRPAQYSAFCSWNIDSEAPLIEIPATTITDTTAVIKWTDNSMDEEGFRIYLNSQQVAQVLTVSGPTTGTVYSHTLTGLTPNTTYLVRVEAYKGTCIALASSEESFITLPSTSSSGSTGGGGTGGDTSGGGSTGGSTGGGSTGGTTGDGTSGGTSGGTTGGTTGSGSTSGSTSGSSGGSTTGGTTGGGTTGSTNGSSVTTDTTGTSDSTSAGSTTGSTDLTGVKLSTTEGSTDKTSSTSSSWSWICFFLFLPLLLLDLLLLYLIWDSRRRVKRIQHTEEKIRQLTNSNNDTNQQTEITAGIADSTSSAQLTDQPTAITDNMLPPQLVNQTEVSSVPASATLLEVPPFETNQNLVESSPSPNPNSIPTVVPPTNQTPPTV